MRRPFEGYSMATPPPKFSFLNFIIPSAMKFSGVYWIHPVRSSVHQLMSHPDPAVLSVGTLHSLEWFWVSRRIFIYSHHNTFVFLAGTKQLYEWYFYLPKFEFGKYVRWSCLSVCPSVCPSVCLSVRHTFFTMFPSSYHHEIFRSYRQGPG